jgi:hypothetical protein
MSDPLPPGVSRRRFITASGAVAGAAVLGACGGGGKKAASTTPSTTPYVLANFFGSGQFAAGTLIRAPFGVADSNGAILDKGLPAETQVVVLDPDDKPVGDPIIVKRHSNGLPRPYYPLEVTLNDPGIYTIKAEKGLGVGNSMALEVANPKDLHLIRPGLNLPPLETPTVSDARGVKPICTLTPPCPLHDVTVAQALTEGKPIGLIVATPYFCKVAICGPVLDLVVSAVKDHPGIRFVHAEVYADPFNDPDIARGGGRLAPAVEALGLPFEPVLILADKSGAVTQRLDSIFDVDELNGALAKMT